MAKHLILLLSLVCCLPLSLWAQTPKAPYLPSPSIRRYVLIQKGNYPVYQVTTRRTGEGYIGITPATVEIFNLFFPTQQHNGSSKLKYSRNDTLLITLSVLPYTDGTIEWKEIRPDTIPMSRMLSMEALEKEGRDRIASYLLTGSPRDRTQLSDEDIYPILKAQGRYWIAAPYVLTEFFLISPKGNSQVGQADMAIIDIKSHIFPVEQLLHDFIKRTGNTHAMLKAAVSSGNLLQRRLGNQYEFWSNPEYNSTPSLLRYGSSNFLYQPGIGIVGGNYLEYFSVADRFTSDSFFEIISIQKLKNN